MTSRPDTAYDGLTPDQAARVDEACDRFEIACKAAGTDGTLPDVRAVLNGFDGPERTALARELAALDRAYRRRRGEAPRPVDYDRPAVADDATAKQPLTTE